MNEGLVIRIRVASDQAKKELDKVKKALNEVKKEGTKIKEVGESFKEVAKDVAVLTTAVTALVAGLTKMGTTAVSLQKTYGRLEAGFAGAGQSAQQAHSVFKGLYRFLGDEDAALEAANLMAQLTGEMEHQKEWITVLQGAYAALPFSVTTESLIESINETVKVGKVTGQTADALNWLKVSEDSVNAALANLNSETEREAYLRSLLLGLYEGSANAYERTNGGVMSYYESQANLNAVLASASKYLIPFLTGLNNMAAVLLQVLAPAIQFVSQVLMVFMRWIVAAANVISALFGGSSTKIKETTNSMGGFSSSVGKASTGMGNLGKGIDNAAKKAEKLKKLTMGFDELNVVNPGTAASGASGADIGGAGGASIPAIDIPSLGDLSESMGLEDFYKDLEEVEGRIQGILVLVGLVSAAFLGWKIFDMITDPAINFKNILKNIGSYALIIAGALLLVQGYSDAWANGIDWGNLALMMAGIAGIVGGLALKFGAVAAGIGLIVGGLALVIVGIKDAVQNGLNFQNVTTILVGLAAIVGGLALAFGPLAAAIGLAVAGVVALVTGIVSLVTNGYSMEAVILVAVGAIGILIGVVWALNSALLANPITWVVVAIMALVAAFVVLWNECDAFRNFWINLWEGIKVAFHAIVEWFKTTTTKMGNFFKELGNKIKETVTNIKNRFTEMKDGVTSKVNSLFTAVTGKFDALKTGITTKINAARDAVKNAVEKIKGFFKFEWSLPKPKLPHFSVSGGEAPWGFGGKGSLPKISISWYARGGVFDSPTLFGFGNGSIGGLGENGAEAVVPLENNLGWLDKLADMLTERMGGSGPIIMEVDGKTFAQISVDSINSLTKQTGSLQLSLV